MVVTVVVVVVAVVVVVEAFGTVAGTFVAGTGVKRKTEGFD